ncbi:MAG TPA: 2-oxo-4-hydroxy-4-carboxy-5-ureidoimidazoline decarboxylase [Kiritimatiellia bacterium]|nr:2-oxo-4-hydroxy-4-carboxy-5-ureidoimidazoline decarboxylase [Kiritimatiellia bacterium]
MKLTEFNALSTDEAVKDLMRCCGARRWAAQVAARRPYNAVESVMKMADDVWAKMDRADLLEAFSHHPKIGDVASLRTKFASTSQWASGEQSGVQAADDDILKRLADGNELYEKRFGYIFIVCATGKTAPEMLALLEERVRNRSEVELRVAAGEQAKITRIRLGKLFHEEVLGDSA